ncbi:putative GNAT family acetyltransferase [Crossiella equi]|uniref:GNAT family acetyltransferase n=1 Tax=Crossiella equi TaxID=130796 RepID=A0ABS5AA63_9PSEU|nr:GNAT family N-acetyltransferase [Crossiella equi]MBP2473094.1 putative GNAT family acetyltransferase [Crossiella equi]
MSDIEVRDSAAEHRYEITVAGVLAGFAEYEQRDGRTLFTHTEVFPEFGGRGLAGVLAEQALGAEHGHGRTVVPLCPFIAGWLRKHPDFPVAVQWPEQS